MRALPPGLALLPLRLFLGATFVYAGLYKLADPGFFARGSDTYIGAQLEGFARGTPGGWLLDTFALPHPGLAGGAVALGELAIGLLTLAGRFTRPVAACGLLLSLLLFLTASWHTSPYFLGSDIVFAFAWLPFLLAGAAGQPALDHRRAHAIRLHREEGATVIAKALAVPATGEPLTRRAAIARALAVTATATAALAGLASVVRGRPTSTQAGARQAVAGTRVAASSAVRPGDALRITNPETGSPALLVRRQDARLVALSAVCTHAGCEVQWRAGRIQCPCHGARFDPATGAPTRGPAQAPLRSLPVHERGGDVFLG